MADEMGQVKDYEEVEEELAEMIKEWAKQNEVPDKIVADILLRQTTIYHQKSLVNWE